ncbi:MAG: Methionine aminopeptidase [Candidatus Woesebacteria bacterium GW2011_GWA1_45_8]|uniref:Methionine aminopeptidase n=1 Tax=Candidatus Woesebacteria bacterium GW2011_GWA1_45_8 TaxID=1618559 RepID=A0A0G1MVQ6_9BACT|nr:MAG: Methionine aminopeptidase [Candidatus Woesebacteria bacterium GW2011_GWA1_45_8]
MMFKGDGSLKPKSPESIEMMRQGGKKLGQVKSVLRQAVKIGVSAEEIEQLARGLIREKGGTPSFMAVPGYSWATCVNVNEGLVHGIPKKEIVFKKGDVVSVDVGMQYEGFHTDTSFTLGLETDSSMNKFLQVGKNALRQAIDQIRAGKRIYDISFAIERTIKGAGLTPVRDLVGHGIGRHLHESPQIPCFTTGARGQTEEIPEGATLAVEVMYAQGSHKVEVAPDGWTIAMRDGKISALFEETVAALASGPLVLTEG